MSFDNVSKFWRGLVRSCDAFVAKDRLFLFKTVKSKLVSSKSVILSLGSEAAGRLQIFAFRSL